MKLRKKYRYFVSATGEVSDPLHDYDKSVTYHFDDNCAESDTKKEMISKIKKDKVELKESNLSKETIAEFEKEKISYVKAVKNEKTINSISDSKRSKSQ